MDSVSRANGGIFEAERRLQQTLHLEMGLDIQVIGLRDEQTDADLSAWSPLQPRTFASRGPRSFGFAPGFVAGLNEAQADLAYSAGLWRYPSLATLKWKRQSDRPLMVAPHGMLDAWALRNSGMKKRIAGWLFQDAQLQAASCLRALCSSEAASIRAYGLKNPICIIPNGIDLPPAHRTSNEPPPPFSDGRKMLLYLGRLHPKKGLPQLLKAWRQVLGNQNQEWVLALAGWDQGGHEAELKRLATELGLSWTEASPQGKDHASLFFLGPKFGTAKAELYAQCHGFILPSLSEGLPMVVLEAWAYGKPVLMTPECNLPDGFAAQAAVRVNPTVEGLAEGLTLFFAVSDEERQTMGNNGLALVKDRFSWPKIASEMKSVYTWMLNGGTPPDCVALT